MVRRSARDRAVTGLEEMMMNRHLTTALVALALAGIGCGDDDGSTTMTSDDMGTPVDMNMTTDMGGTDMFTPTDMFTSTREPAEALADARELGDEAATLGCECDMTGFESVEACAAFDGTPDDYETCLDTAYADNLAAQGASQVCFTDALDTYVGCLDAADCDETAGESCFETYFNSLSACPDGSDAYFTAVDACVATHITGEPATDCPNETITLIASGEAATGTTLGAGSEFELSCNAGGAPDYVFSWTAPSNGTFTFDTIGSSYDTALAIFDGCEGDELACNDDGESLENGLLSELTIEATLGTTYTIVVSGYNETTAGDFVLNLTFPAATK